MATERQTELCQNDKWGTAWDEWMMRENDGFSSRFYNRTCVCVCLLFFCFSFCESKREKWLLNMLVAPLKALQHATVIRWKKTDDSILCIGDGVDGKHSLLRGEKVRCNNSYQSWGGLHAGSGISVVDGWAATRIKMRCAMIGYDMCVWCDFCTAGVCVSCAATNMCVRCRCSGGDVDNDDDGLMLMLMMVVMRGGTG